MFYQTNVNPYENKLNARTSYCRLYSHNEPEMSIEEREQKEARLNELIEKKDRIVKAEAAVNQEIRQLLKDLIGRL